MPEPSENMISLFHRRWAVPILSEMAATKGAKLITLQHRLGVGRTTLRATLDDLIALGLVERNPGHGHPMRPEYLLTPKGCKLAPFSGRLRETVTRMGVEPIAFRKWTLPITYAMGDHACRFNELRDELHGITPRALTLALKDMQRERLVSRAVLDTYPPATAYSLTRRAGPMLTSVSSLARAI